MNINDPVLVTFKGNQYKGIIIDVEECHEYDEAFAKRSGYANPLVKTGRFGIKFDDTNPTLIDVPYFYSRDIQLVCD